MALADTWRGAALLALVATLTSCDDDPGILAIQEPFGRVPVSVSISTPSSVIPIVGGELQLTAAVVTGDGTSASTAGVRWRSLDPEVVSVTESGLATGIAEGTARIEASLVNLADTVTLTVARLPATLNVSPDSVVLTQVGETTTAVAQVLDLNGEPLDSAVTWTSSNTNVASVNDSGVITAEGEGLAVVTARAAAVRDELLVRVDTGVAVLQLSVDSISFSAVGDSTWFEVTALDVLGNEVDSVELAYVVTDTTVAQVVGDSVLVSRGSGVTVLTVEVTGTSIAEQIPVVVELIPVSLDVFVELVEGGPRRPDVATLETFTSFTAEVEAVDANGFAFTPLSGVVWTNSDSTVVTLDVTGVGTAFLQLTDPGSTTIVASLDGLADSLVYTVNEVPSLSMSLDRDTVFFTVGATQEITPTFSTPDSADLCCGQAVWSSSDSAVVGIAPVPPTGLQVESSVFLEAEGVGTAWVYATRGALVDSVYVAVTPAAEVGAQASARAPVTPAGGTRLETPRPGAAVVRTAGRRPGGRRSTRR